MLIDINGLTVWSDFSRIFLVDDAGSAFNCHLRGLVASFVDGRADFAFAATICLRRGHDGTQAQARDYKKVFFHDVTFDVLNSLFSHAKAVPTHF